MHSKVSEGFAPAAKYLRGFRRLRLADQYVNNMTSLQKVRPV